MFSLLLLNYFKYTTLSTLNWSCSHFYLYYNSQNLNTVRKPRDLGFSSGGGSNLFHMVVYQLYRTNTKKSLVLRPVERQFLQHFQYILFLLWQFSLLPIDPALLPPFYLHDFFVCKLVFIMIIAEILLTWS